MDCLKDPTPCRHSPVCMIGIFSRDFSKFNFCSSLFWVAFSVYLVVG